MEAKPGRVPTALRSRGRWPVLEEFVLFVFARNARFCQGGAVFEPIELLYGRCRRGWLYPRVSFFILKNILKNNFSEP